MVRGNRSRSRSTSRDRERSKKERERDRDRSDRDKNRDRDRDRDRDRERSHRHGGSSSGAKSSKRSRSRSRSPRHRSKKDRRKSDSRSPSPYLTLGGGVKSSKPSDKLVILDPQSIEGKTDEEIQMLKVMGFSGFDSTKGKYVEGANHSAISIQEKRKYRQYMNRKGGFNRPLDPVA